MLIVDLGGKDVFSIWKAMRLILDLIGEKAPKDSLLIWEARRLRKSALTPRDKLIRVGGIT